MDAWPEFGSQRLIQKGLKSISGNKWLNSIIMTAVMVNQIAENTGAVVRNFFMVLEDGNAGGMDAQIAGEASNQFGVISGANQRGDTVILLSASVSLPLVNSPKAAKGQVAAARVLLKARGTSI